MLLAYVGARGRVVESRSAIALLDARLASILDARMAMRAAACGFAREPIAVDGRRQIATF